MSKYNISELYSIAKTAIEKGKRIGKQLEDAIAQRDYNLTQELLAKIALKKFEKVNDYVVSNTVEKLIRDVYKGRTIKKPRFGTATTFDKKKARKEIKEMMDEDEKKNKNNGIDPAA